MRILNLTILYVLFCFQAISQFPVDYTKVKNTILQADTIYISLNEVGCFTSDQGKIIISTKDFKIYSVNFLDNHKSVSNTTVLKSNISEFLDVLIKEIKRKRECEFIITTIITIEGNGENLQYMYGCHDEKNPLPERLKKKLKLIG